MPRRSSRCSRVERSCIEESACCIRVLQADFSSYFYYCVCVGRDFEEGEFGKVLRSLEKKFVCSICGKACDSEQEAVEKFLENHDLEDLDGQ